MATPDRHQPDDRIRLNRRSFLKRVGWGGVGATALVGAGRRSSSAQTTPVTYPDWIPASTKPPKRGSTYPANSPTQAAENRVLPLDSPGSSRCTMSRTIAGTRRRLSSGM